MPLHSLNLAHNMVADLDALRGMKLNFLCCFSNRVCSLEPLSGMPLNSFIFHNNPVVDLAPLRGMPLTTLNCSGCQIRSLDPLRGMKLTVLHCSENEIESLEPLRGRPLVVLTCHRNRIRDLLPLKEMRLAALSCGRNPLTSLAPFLRHPPEDFRFDCDSIPTREYQAAREKWSRDFRYQTQAREVSVLLALRARDWAKLKALSVEFNNHRYLHIPRMLSWMDAQRFCADLGGHLLTIHSLRENMFVESFFKGGCWFWLGLEVRNGQPAWVTGEPVSYTNFTGHLTCRMEGPKVFSGQWQHEVLPGAINTFMIEWDA